MFSWFTGGCKDIDDPSRLSLASFSTSVWNDNISFLSLRPDLDLCPLTPQNRLAASASALSLQYSPSVLSLRSEGHAPMQNGCSNSGSVGNLQLEGAKHASARNQRNEYSHSSLPSSVRLKVNEGGRKRSRDERPYSMYTTYQPGRRPFKARPRSLAVSAISEDGDYIADLDNETESVCGSEMSDVSSLNNSVFSNSAGSGGYRTSTPLMTPTSPPLMEESGSDPDSEYRLPPPGMTPKILHDSSRAASSISHGSSASLSSSKSSANISRFVETESSQNKSEAETSADAVQTTNICNNRETSTRAH